MGGDGLLEPATAERLRRAAQGEDATRRLRLAALAAGDVGVLTCDVRSVSPVRTYRRKRGGEGLLCRVTLADATGEVDLVLWDDETALARDGPFRPGALVRLTGAQVRPGLRGGVELALGSAEVTAVEAGEAVLRLEGVLAAVGETRPSGDRARPRFSAEVRLDTPAGPRRVVVWDPLLQEIRALAPGSRVALDGVAPHPALDGWHLATPSTRLRNG